MRHLSVPYDGIINNEAVFDFDFGKLNIFCNGCMSGKALMDALRADYHLELEMALGGRALAMTSVCDTDEGFDRLVRALKEIDSRCTESDHAEPCAACPLPQKRYAVHDALEQDGVMLDICQAEGKVSREYVRAYPPGVPLLVPGEVIDRDVLSQLSALEAAENVILTDSSAFPLISIIG